MTKANVDEMKATSKDPCVRRAARRSKAGSASCWASTTNGRSGAIKVGRQLRRDLRRATSGRRRSDLPRGLNKLWSKGGLQYALPFR